MESPAQGVAQGRAGDNSEALPGTEPGAETHTELSLWVISGVVCSRIKSQELLDRAAAISAPGSRPARHFDGVVLVITTHRRIPRFAVTGWRLGA